MSKVVNLSKARKARARDAARKTADANAVKFGRTQEVKAKDRAEADKAARDLDGHKRG
ncbi:MAG: DUF4169 family protein [Pseudomonadota bacterium]